MGLLQRHVFAVDLRGLLVAMQSTWLKSLSCSTFANTARPLFSAAGLAGLAAAAGFER
jgi:hypothetical protein